MLILAIVLGRLQNNARNAGRVDIFTGLTRILVNPVSNSVTAISGFSRDFVGGMSSAHKLQVDNRRMKEMMVGLELYDQEVARLHREIDDLRSTVQMSQLPGRTPVWGEVVGFYPYENRITVNVGKSRGIQTGMPVVAGRQLVGLAQTVESGQSQVILLTSFGQQIGAIDQDRNPPPAGLVRGKDYTTLQMTFVDPQAPVQSGDHIVTAGFSTKIPRGLLIGRVIAVINDVEFGSRRASIDPSINLGSLREVQILK